VIQLPVGIKVWIAVGVTDLRRGFDGLSAQVQNVLHEKPFSGHVFVFRGRKGDIVKLLWWGGMVSVCLPSVWSVVDSSD
jgi:transposase